MSFSPCIFPWGFFSVGFTPWAFLRGFLGVAQGLVVDSVSSQGSSLEMGLPDGCLLGP